MRLIDVESLAKKLGIANNFDCKSCDLYGRQHRGCKNGNEFEYVCFCLETAPVIKPTIKFETEKR